MIGCVGESINHCGTEWLVASLTCLATSGTSWYPEDLWYPAMVSGASRNLLAESWSIHDSNIFAWWECWAAKFQHLRIQGKPLCSRKTAPLIVDIAMSWQALLLWGADNSRWVIFGPTKHAIIDSLGISWGNHGYSRGFKDFLFDFGAIAKKAGLKINVPRILVDFGWL